MSLGEYICAGNHGCQTDEEIGKSPAQQGRDDAAKKAAEDAASRAGNLGAGLVRRSAVFFLISSPRSTAAFACCSAT